MSVVSRISLLLVLFTASLASCGTGRTMILQAAAREYRVEGFRLQHADSTAAVPTDVIAKFEAGVRKRTDQAGLSMDGPLLLKYRFIQYSAGSQFQRWFWGGLGNAGEGSLTCEVSYLDSEGKEIAKIQSEGRISSGMFGGSMGEALERLAQEVADYTVQHFGQPNLKPIATPRTASDVDP